MNKQNTYLFEKDNKNRPAARRAPTPDRGAAAAGRSPAAAPPRPRRRRPPAPRNIVLVYFNLDTNKENRELAKYCGLLIPAARKLNLSLLIPAARKWQGQLSILFRYHLSWGGPSSSAAAARSARARPWPPRACERRQELYDNVAFVVLYVIILCHIVS